MEPTVDYTSIGTFEYIWTDYQSEEYDVLISNGWVIHRKFQDKVELIRPLLN